MVKLIPLDNMSETERLVYDNLPLDVQLDYDERLTLQEVGAYVKEYNRLLRKYGDARLISVESVMGYPYFEDMVESLICTGGKLMAQYDGYNLGAWSSEEVDLWK